MKRYPSAKTDDPANSNFTNISLYTTACLSQQYGKLSEELATRTLVQQIVWFWDD